MIGADGLNSRGDPGSRSSTGRYLVGEQHHRLRLDRYLQAVRPDLSRGAIEELLRTGAVVVREHARDGRYYVKRGDWIEIRDVRQPPAHLEPVLVLRSAHLLVAGKPPGMATNPVGLKGSSLLDWVALRLAAGASAARAETGPGERPPAAQGSAASAGVVHRLDRDASGVVCFSLSPEAHRRLLEAFRRRRIGKRYLALVAGPVRPREGTIDLPLARGTSGRVRPDPRGAPAQTSYRVLRSRADVTLLEVRPRSGRMHQIRVHLSAAGHAILGDPLYGSPRHAPHAPRLWLHALALEFPPRLAEILQASHTLTCPLWPDLAAHGRELGLPGLEEWD
jgi:RluA family pseudouridine synthase